MYLITGAAGFIGFHLSLSLLKQGKVVVGIDNINAYYNTKIKHDRLKILSKFPKFKFFKIDLTNEKIFTKKIKKYKNKIKNIVHLAGQAGVRYSIENPSTYIQNNILAYVKLLEFFKKSKSLKLVIYASSSSVYGEIGSKHSQSFKPQINPISVYSASKLSMELISNVYKYIYNINFIGVRFFSVYGPWGRPDMFYLKYLESMRNRKPIKVYNHGNHYRSFTYIDDVISNIHKIINKFSKKKVSYSDVFNIGNPNSIYLKSFIRAIEKITRKKAKKIYIKRQMGDLKTTKSNVLREIRVFNHQTKTPLKEGLRKLISWHTNYFK